MIKYEVQYFTPKFRPYADEVGGIPASEAEQLEILHNVLQTETEHGAELNFLQALYNELSEAMSRGDQEYRWETNANPLNYKLTWADTSGFLRTQHIPNLAPEYRHTHT
jgi:hypothetical protein